MSVTVYRITIGAAFVLSAIAMYGVTRAASGTRSTSSPPAGSSTRSQGPNDGFSDSSKRRVREGTTIHDQAGYFRQDGDGATFVTDEGIEFGGLPNLNLERVARTLKTADEAKSIRWSVSGMITEFSGRNFLLISRAIYKSTPPPPTPEQLSN